MPLAEEEKEKIREEEKYRAEAKKEAEVEAKKKPLLKQNIGCGGSILIIIIIVIVIAIFSSGGDNKSTQPTTQTETPSEAFMLASLEIGHNNPSASLVKTFDDLLGKLEEKCPQDSENEIANYIFKGQKLIKEKGGTVTLLEFGNALNESIPEEMAGVVNCAEMAAVLVVLVIDE